MRLATLIIHAAHILERKKSYQRLVAQLAAAQIGVNYTEMHKGPFWEWFEKALTWATSYLDVSQAPSHILWLQDDVVLCNPETFRARIEEYIDAWPGSPICLHSNLVGAGYLHDEGKQYYTTADGIVGTACIFPIRFLKDFAHYRRTHWHPWVLQSERYSEDTQLALMCLQSNTQVVHPVVSPIDMDTSIVSTWNRSNVRLQRIGHRPTLTETDYSPCIADYLGTPRLGRLYYSTPEQLDQALKVRLLDDELRDMRRTQAPHALYNIRKVAADAPRHILIATPDTGSVTGEYADALFMLGQAIPKSKVSIGRVSKKGLAPSIVDARNQLVRHALESDVTDVVWIDNDHAPRFEVIEAMLASPHELSFCSYPRKEIQSHAIGLALERGLPWDAYSSQYVIKPKPGAVQEDDFIEAVAGGMGLCVTKRTLLERMARHQLKQPESNEHAWYYDLPGYIRTANLFPVRRNPDTLRNMGEDIWFMKLAREIGHTRAMLYVGPHTPIDHIGKHVYRGCFEGLQATIDVEMMWRET